MRLKTIEVEGKTYAEVADDKPVYVHSDGKEVPFDGPSTIKKISELNAEAKGHREGKEAAEAKLKAFEGIEDAEAAKKAIETIKNIDEGQLVAAGKVEEIKAAAKRSAEEQVAAAQKAAARDLDAMKVDRDKLQSDLHNHMIGGAFSGSKFIADKAAVPADLMQSRFGTAFKVEDGKLVAYDGAGNKIYSRAKAGEIAEFDEALEMLVDAYPYREHILKGVGGGSGAKPGEGGAGDGKSITRAEFDRLDPVRKSEVVTKGTRITD